MSGAQQNRKAEGNMNSKNNGGRIFVSSSLAVFLTACGSPNYEPSQFHVTAEEVASRAPADTRNIPRLVKQSPTLPSLHNRAGSETFDVVVTNVPARDLLFALARDASINMDIDSRVGGVVSLSALDQTLDAILDRIAEQISMRVERRGDVIIVKPDEAYFKYYEINYANISRTASSDASASAVGDSDAGSASISNTMENNFWDSLDASIGAILNIQLDGDAEALNDIRVGDAGREAILSQAQEGELRSSASQTTYQMHRETGVLMVYAPESLQLEVEELVNRIMRSAGRQVLLEATIVEVILNNKYKQGIDWSVFRAFHDGLSIYQGGVIGATAAAFNAALREQSFTHEGGNLVDEVVAATTYTEQENLVRQYYGLAEFEQVSSFELTPAEGDTPAELSVTLSRLNRDPNQGGLSPRRTSSDNFFTLAYQKDNFSAAVQLLDTFGDAKVLSSPRISALNNQPALLRVVDQEVYFDVTVEEEVNQETGIVTGRNVTVEEQVVDVGFSLNVMPQIGGDDRIILNLKPTVTRILGYVDAPVVVTGLNTGQAENRVPVTRVRELESIIALRDGEVAVLGGLLEDRTTDNDTAIPGLSALPGIGALFQNRDEETYKTEFVVFIRAKIVRDPSLYGDFSEYRKLLPEGDFIIRSNRDTAFPPEQLPTR